MGLMSGLYFKNRLVVVHDTWGDHSHFPSDRRMLLKNLANPSLSLPMIGSIRGFHFLSQAISLLRWTFMSHSALLFLLHSGGTWKVAGDSSPALASVARWRARSGFFPRPRSS